MAAVWVVKKPPSVLTRGSCLDTPHSAENTLEPYSSTPLISPPPPPEHHRRDIPHSVRTLLPRPRSGHSGDSGLSFRHRLDELPVPSLGMQDLEVEARERQHCCTSGGHRMHRRRRLAHQVEQSTHLPRGLLRPPACLRRADGSTSVRKVDIRLPGKGNSNSRGARPVYSNHFDDYVDSDQ